LTIRDEGGKKMKGKGILSLGILGLGLVLMAATPAAANTIDTLHLSCAGCFPFGVTLAIQNRTGTFSLSNVGGSFSGTLFVIVYDPLNSDHLVPGAFQGSLAITGGQTFTDLGLFTGGGFTDALPGILPAGVNLNGYDFLSIAGASREGGDPAISFLVREWTATSQYINGFANCCTFTDLNRGAVIIAFVQDAAGNVI
jgi:hypothetical protein